MEWMLREDGIEPAYRPGDDYFSIEMHHGGKKMCVDEEIVYLDGYISFFDWCDPDKLSLLEFGEMASQLGHKGNISYFWRKEGLCLTKGLTKMLYDKDVVEMGLNIPSRKLIEVYLEHKEDVHGTINCQTQIEDGEGDNRDGQTSDAEDNNGDDDPDQCKEKNVEYFYDTEFEVDADDLEDEVDTTRHRASNRDQPRLAMIQSRVVKDGQGCSYNMDNLGGNITDSDYAPSDHLSECDSESEKEGEAGTKRSVRVRYPEFRVERDLPNPIFEIGMKFSDYDEFKKAAREYGIINRYRIWFPSNDQKRCQALCKKGCTFRIWVSSVRDSDSVQIKTMNLEHTCSKDFYNPHATSKWLANKYLDTFRADPKWSNAGIIERVRADLSLEISRLKAWRTRAAARSLLQGDEDDQYLTLPAYLHEIMRTNPGSTTLLKLECSLFKRMYICIAACKKGLLSGCRPILCIDGCFLKGRYGGQLLCAVGIDPNDCIYPVAYAVVERENTDSWDWFLSILGEDLQIHSGSGWTFMSDRQKGLRKVLNNRFPNSDTRFCVRHMYTNLVGHCTTKLTQKIKDYIWHAARATHVAEFKKWMAIIKTAHPEAYKWLEKKPAKEWSRSHFTTFPKCDMLLNNLSECFNNWILDSRDKPIRTMVEQIRCRMMLRIQKKRSVISRHNGSICPQIEKKVEKIKDEAFRCKALWSGGSKFQVSLRDFQFVVDLEAKTCACRKWDISGIPCAHAVSCMMLNNMCIEDHIYEGYKKETYLRVYSHIINPINGQQLWETVELGDPIIPPPIIVKKGRRQTNRKKDAAEIQQEKEQGSKYKKVSRKGVVMTCKECGQQGHNIRSHRVGKGTKRKETTSAPSDGQTRKKLLVQRNRMDANLGSYNESTVQLMTDGTWKSPTS